MQTTQKQLAEEMNVSVMTVSRALRGDRGVSEETRTRIREYAEKVNYSPNLVARSLVSKRSSVLGLLIPDLRDAFWLDMVLGAEKVLRETGYRLLLAHSGSDPNYEREEIETLLSRQVDALLIAACSPDHNIDILQRIQARGIPVIAMDRRLSDPSLPGVYTDDTNGSRQAMQHLLGIGYTRIAHLAGDLRFHTALERLRVYQQEMNARNLACIYRETDFSEEAGYRAMQSLLSETVPEAVFTANDPVAIGALTALQEAGLRVPEQVALVGYGNIGCASHISVPLTSVMQPRQELGAAIARMALKRIACPSETVADVVLPTQLIIRKSCGSSLRSGLSGEPASSRNGESI